MTSSERRLHPFSFLFWFLSKAITVPLVVLGVGLMGGGEVKREIFKGLMVAGFFAVYSLIKTRSFRYRLNGRELVVREGILSRTERHIPYHRIQNVVQRRNVLHRVFGVTELRLESAGGSRPEAVMAVITEEAARHIEDVLRDHGPAVSPAVTHGDAAEVLLTTRGPELWRLGLISDRGWQAVGAVVALLLSQSEFRALLSPAGLQRGSRWLSGWAGSLLHDLGGRTTQALALGLMLVAAVVLLKLLSVAMAVVIFHGFQLRRQGQRLTTESGLFERRVSSVRPEKIQRLCLIEPWLGRVLGRRSLACAVDAGHDSEDDRLSWLVPIGTPGDLDALLQDLAPGLSLQRNDWRPLHRRAWRRRATGPGLLVMAATLTACWYLGPVALVVGAAILGAVLLEARAWVAFSGHVLDGNLLVFREGGWRRRWLVTWLEKAQTVGLSRSPLDVRQGMATVRLDTAGVSAAAPSLRIPYLPEPEARALAAELQRLVGARLRSQAPKAA